MNHKFTPPYGVQPSRMEYVDALRGFTMLLVVMMLMSNPAVSIRTGCVHACPIRLLIVRRMQADIILFYR